MLICLLILPFHVLTWSNYFTIILKAWKGDTVCASLNSTDAAAVREADHWPQFLNDEGLCLCVRVRAHARARVCTHMEILILDFKGKEMTGGASG